MIAPSLVAAWWLVSFSPAAPLPPDALLPELSGAEARAEGSERSESPPEPTHETEVRVKPKLVTPAIVQAAEELLDLPMGAEQYQTIDGKRYVFVLELHYHPPGFVGAPNGWHKGVTVYRVE
jgi:hypothetical protein